MTKRICPVCEEELPPHHKKGRPPTYHPGCRKAAAQTGTARRRICIRCDRPYTLKNFNDPGNTCPDCRATRPHRPCHYCGEEVPRRGNVRNIPDSTPRAPGKKEDRHARVQIGKLQATYCSAACERADWGELPPCRYPGCTKTGFFRPQSRARRGPTHFCEDHFELRHKVIQKAVDGMKPSIRKDQAKRLTGIRKALQAAGFTVSGRPPTPRPQRKVKT